MIGLDRKQLVPQQLIVDGQQRLTSLYAVTKGVPVLTEDYKESRIQIAFSPITERFEVANATVQSPEWIANISEVWNSPKGLFEPRSVQAVDRLMKERKVEISVKHRSATAVPSSCAVLLSIPGARKGSDPPRAMYEREA